MARVCSRLWVAWLLSAATTNAAQLGPPVVDPCALPGRGSNAGQLVPPANFTAGADSVGAQASVAVWLHAITAWRAGCRAKLHLNGSVYESVPRLKWTQSTFIQPQIHPWDNYFYNHTVAACACWLRSSSVTAAPTCRLTAPVPCFACVETAVYYLDVPGGLAATLWWH
jgi:hypothetical protein